MDTPKIRWIISESWCEVIERWDAFCVTREEAIAEWEACYGRKFNPENGSVDSEVGSEIVKEYWRQGKHYVGFYPIEYTY